MSGVDRAAGARWVAGFAHAWVAQDVAALDDLFTEGVAMHWDLGGEPLVGLEDLRAYWVAEGDLQSRIRLRWPDPLVSGATVVGEFWVQMDYRGTEASDPAAIAAAHAAGPSAARAVCGQLCVIAELDDESRCARLRQYQLGGDGDAEPPAWWGTNAARSEEAPAHRA